jgi:FAD:protein FMN transferase
MSYLIIKKIYLIVILIIFSIFIFGCETNNIEIKEYSSTKEMMNTFVTITVYSNNEEKANSVINLAFEEIKIIEKKLSIFDNNSEIYKLNENKFLITNDFDIRYIINESINYYHLTNKAFDITVQPILELYSESFRINNSPPSDIQIQELLEKIGANNILIKDNGIYFLNDKIKITLGGIAKGYAVDKAVLKLKENNISSGIVNLGGDLFSFGKKPDGNEFIIALQNPRNKEDYIAKFNISNKAVTTSGDYEKYFDDEKKSHHILNPITGKSALGVISATVISDSAIKSDALSTAIFVLGHKKGIELINSLENTEALIITTDKELFYSDNFPR